MVNTAWEAFCLLFLETVCTEKCLKACIPHTSRLLQMCLVGNRASSSSGPSPWGYLFIIHWRESTLGEKGFRVRTSGQKNFSAAKYCYSKTRKGKVSFYAFTNKRLFHMYNSQCLMLTPAVSAVHNSIAFMSHIHRTMHFTGTISPLLHTFLSYSTRCYSGSIRSDILHHENVAARLILLPGISLHMRVFKGVLLQK